VPLELLPPLALPLPEPDDDPLEPLPLLLAPPELAEVPELLALELLVDAPPDEEPLELPLDAPELVAAPEPEPDEPPPDVALPELLLLEPPVVTSSPPSTEASPVPRAGTNADPPQSMATTAPTSTKGTDAIRRMRMPPLPTAYFTHPARGQGTRPGP
jgi:hypothetical protein